MTTLPIVEVTVQEDRALVRREGDVALQPGRNRIRIEGVAPVLVDKSLAAELRPGEGAPAGAQPEVLGIRVKRWRVTEDAQRPAALAELRGRLRELEAAHLERSGACERVDAELVAVEAMLAQSVAELGQDAGWGRVDLAHARATLDAWQERLLALGQRRCELQAEIGRHERDLADLRRLEQAAHTVAGHAAAALDVDLHWSGAEPSTARLRVDYLVPGALWRPWHRAQLLDDGDAPQVHLHCDGCVWQATGEDWTDVSIVLSTERPSLGLRPPLLQTDRLAVRKKGPDVQVQARDQQIYQAGLGGDEGRTEAAEQLPGIDDGGEARRLRGRVRATVPGDGRPHRVPLFELRSPATVELRCMPELATAVVLRSEQTNVASQPLLAGPVDLVRDSGLVGRTSLLYVAPGERFELGWGPDAALRVTREVEHLDQERRALSSWTRKPRKVTVKLSNLDARPRTVKLRERMAVSEIDKVEVELTASEPTTQADADGILEWDVRLQGLGRAQVSVTWTLVVHDDVRGL